MVNNLRFLTKENKNLKLLYEKRDHKANCTSLGIQISTLIFSEWAFNWNHMVRTIDNETKQLIQKSKTYNNVLSSRVAVHISN